MAQVIEFEKYTMEARWNCNCGAIHQGLVLVTIRADKAKERFNKKLLELIIDVVELESPS